MPQSLKKQSTVAGRFRASLQRFFRHPAVDFIIIIAILASVSLLFIELELSESHPFFRHVEIWGLVFTGFFVVELSLRWYAAPTNRRFWREYWLDVIAILPFLRPLRIFRILRVLRIYRMGVMAKRSIASYNDYDFEHQIREDIQNYRGRFASYIWLAPELFRMLTTLLDDGRVHKEARNKILVTIAYFITPFEVLSKDLHGSEGYLDQVYVALETIQKLRQELPDWLLQESWEGEGDIIDILDERDEIREYLDPDATVQLNKYLGWHSS